MLAQKTMVSGEQALISAFQMDLVSVTVKTPILKLFHSVRFPTSFNETFFNTVNLNKLFHD